MSLRVWTLDLTFVTRPRLELPVMRYIVYRRGVEPARRACGVPAQCIMESALACNRETRLAYNNGIRVAVNRHTTML